MSDDVSVNASTNLHTRLFKFLWVAFGNAFCVLSVVGFLDTARLALYKLFNYIFYLFRELHDSDPPY